MSFTCGFCRKTAPVGTPMRRVVTKTRVKPNGGVEIAVEKPMCQSCWDKGETDGQTN